MSPPRSHAKGVVLLCGIVLVCSVGTTAVVGQEDPVTVEASNIDIDAGDSTLVPIRVTAVPNGLSGYSITASVGDGSIVSVAGGEYSQSFGLTVSPTVSGDSVTLEAIDTEDQITSGETSVLLGYVSIEAESAGETTIDITVSNLDNDSGDDIQTVTSSGRVVVSEAETTTSGGGGGGGGGGGFGGGYGSGSDNGSTDEETSDNSSTATPVSLGTQVEPPTDIEVQTATDVVTPEPVTETSQTPDSSVTGTSTTGQAGLPVPILAIGAGVAVLGTVLLNRLRRNYND